MSRPLRRSLFFFVVALTALLFAMPANSFGEGDDEADTGYQVLGGVPDTAAAAPEAEEPQLGPPDLLQELQYGDPGAGIEIMEPPETDSFGEAELSYPMELPTGRGGFQPQVGLLYGSGGDDGFLGVGWDLSLDAIKIPGFGTAVSAEAITVDDRWGVPRYDSGKESETYDFGGQQLSPTAHRAEQLDRRPERRYLKRVEGSYLLIVRHGDSPKNYWWEVSDKVGNKYFYGGTYDIAGDSSTGHRDDSAVLTDESGNGYYWALREKWDISTNVVTYFYDKEHDSGVGDGTDGPMGQQLYLSRINYTGSKLDPDPPLTPLPRLGNYDVTFVRDKQLGEPRRPDVSMEGTFGALEVTAQLLRKINITYCPQRFSFPTTNCATTPQPVRSYELKYKKGAFDKTLLASVSKAGSDGEAYATHTFDYYNDVQDGDGNYNGFAPPVDWHASTDAPDPTLIDFSGGRPDSSALGASKSLGGDGRFYIGFNPLEPVKDLSAGGGLQFSGSSGDSIIETMDINGDGLTDKVVDDGGTVRYRLNQSIAHPEQPFETGPAHVAEGLPSLSKNSSFSVGVSGEEYFGVAVMAGKTWSFYRQPAYFSDVNADGLPDFVNHGTVFFNHRAADGSISFSATSTGTPVPINRQPIDPSVIPDNTSAIAAAQAAQFPKQDTIRRWVAPYDGTIEIDAPVNVHDTTSADGVRVAIQHNGDELWHAAIPGHDSAVRTPTGVDHVAVSAGDRVYFRLQPGADGTEDIVDWQPRIGYVGKGQRLDENDLDVYHYDSASDFTLSGRKGTFVVMPYNGTVRLDGLVHKDTQVSDNIRAVVMKGDTAVCEKDIPAGSVGDFDLACTFSVIGAGNPTGDPGSRISVQLQVDSQIDVRQVSWTPKLVYTSGTDADGNALPDPGKLVLTPPVTPDTYPLTDQTSPIDPYDAPENNDNMALRVEDKQGESIPDALLPATGTFTMKYGKDLVKKVRFTMGPVDPFSCNFFDPTCVPAHTLDCSEGTGCLFEFDEDSHDYFHLTFTFDDPRVGQRVNAFGNGLVANKRWAGVSLHPEAPDIFPAPYRGWALGGYNGGGPLESQPIDESLLLLPINDYPRDRGPDPGDPDYKNPVLGAGYPYSPKPADGRWQGPKDNDNIPGLGATWGKGAQMSTSLLGPDTLGAAPGDPVVYGGGANAPEIRGTGDQDSIGADVLGAVGTGLSWGHSKGEVDYMDMNGDGYPDTIGDGVEYTNQVGTNAFNQSVPGLGSSVREDHETAIDFDGAGSPAAVDGSPKGEGGTGGADSDVGGAPKKGGGNGKKAAKGGKKAAAKAKAMKALAAIQKVGANLGVSGSIGQSATNDKDPLVPYPPDIQDPNTDLIEDDLADMNGDGLPDRVTVDDHGTMQVRWNLGYRFTGPVTFPGADTLEGGTGDEHSLGAGLGFSVEPMAISGGVSLGEATDVTDTSWDDLNGDGLPDELERHGDGDVTVAFNMGGRLGPKVHWGHFESNRIGRSDTTSLGGGADLTIGLGPLCFPTEFCWIIVNPGAHVSASYDATSVAIRDMNGDDLEDSVSSDSEDTLHVALNKTGRSNLLKTVHRPLGGSLTIEYKREGNTVDQPESQWVMSKVDEYDGHPGDGQDHQVTSYTYSGGRFSHAEREDLGYHEVIEAEQDSAGNTLRSYDRLYQNSNYYNRGLLQNETMYKGTVATGTPLTSTTPSYTLVDGNDGTPLADGDEFSTVRTVYPRMDSLTQRWLNPDGSTAKSSRMDYTYDARANMTRVVDRGEPATGDDDVTADMTFTYCDDPNAPVDADGNPIDVGHQNNPDYPWTQMPYKLLVHTDTKVLQRREADLPCDYAAVTQVRDYLDPNSNAADKVAVTDVTYVDVGGQLKDVIGPGPGVEPDDIGGPDDERYAVHSEWDQVGAHPIATSDSRGLRSTQTWDERYDRLASSTQANGALTTYTYDPQARLTSVTGPFERGGSKPTVAFEYHPAAPNPWALAKNIDPANPGRTFDTIDFQDGLGRDIQTQKPASIFTGVTTASNVQTVVSGAVSFDALGRPTDEYYPTTQAPGTAGVFSNALDAAGPTHTVYDGLDRVTSVTEPGNRVTTDTYGFAAGPFGAPMFTDLQTDPAGKRTRTYSNVREETVGKELLHRTAAGADQNLFTRYDYDPLSRLAKLTDPGGAVTTTAYDMFGRRTSITSPDSGVTSFNYDLASNQIGKVTSNLAGTGKQVAYDYALDRIVGIRYPNRPASNITYVYGAGNAGNSAGLVTEVRGGANPQKRTYDAFGEMTAQSTTNTDGAATTRFTYDTWGRMLNMTYPDGEVLNYGYDAGGLPSSVAGQGSGSTTPPKGGKTAAGGGGGKTDGGAAGGGGAATSSYVTRLEYDKFGNERFMGYGNGVNTLWSYDPATLFPVSQDVTGGQYRVQNLRYSYDPAGNVLARNDIYPRPNSTPLTVSAQTMRYDDLARLTSATVSEPGGHAVTTGYTYDPEGRVSRKTQRDVLMGAVQRPTTYDEAFVYAGPHPHAPTKIGSRNYSWDANGNLTRVTDPGVSGGGTGKRIGYNEDNRVISVIGDAGGGSSFNYDDQGELAESSRDDGTTTFANRYWSWAGVKSQRWKDVYIGDDRVATKPSGGSAFFLTSDLTGSVNFMTGAAGAPVEQTSYLPSGEIYYDTGTPAVSYHQPYLFAGSLFDPFRNLNIMGDRAYVPREQMFYSSDPELTGNLEAAVSDPQLLDAYSYAANNPATEVDEDGHLPSLAATALRTVFGDFRKQQASGNLGSPQATARAPRSIPLPAAVRNNPVYRTVNKARHYAQKAKDVEEAFNKHKTLKGIIGFEVPPLFSFSFTHDLSGSFNIKTAFKSEGFDVLGIKRFSLHVAHRLPRGKGKKGP